MANYLLEFTPLNSSRYVIQGDAEPLNCLVED
jgi:hypothetical protein